MKHTLLICLFSSTIFCFAQNPVFIPPTQSGTSFNLELQTGQVQFLPGAMTNTMGANGNLLGPTLILQKHDNIQIDVTNSLGEPTTLHWHGLHVAPENDGGPHTVINAGDTWSPSFEVLDWAGTYWYHPHLHHKTNEHVQKGIAGFVLVNDPVEGALDLPRTYGVDDFPLAIQTKAFDATNQIIIESALDVNLMVNGTMDAYLDAPAQVIRLRLLNGSSERSYLFGLSNGDNLHHIGSDGGLLELTNTTNRLWLSPGERAEVLVNLSGLEGQSIDLMSFGAEIPSGNYGAAQPGMGAGQTIPDYTSNPLNGSNFVVLSLNVQAPSANPVTSIPTSLVPHVIWDEADANLTRNLVFSSVNMGPTAIQGPFLIDGAAFNMMVVNQYVPFENIEIWTLTNNTPISHPFHIHDVQFYVLDINGVPPPAYLSGRKDVVLVPAGQGVVRFITQFDDFYNDTLPYMYHCHMLTHEDDGMMGQFVVNSPSGVGFENAGLIAEYVNVYPNPAQHEITVDVNGDYGCLSLFDATGREVLLLEPSANGATKVDVSGIREGIYFLKLAKLDGAIKIVLSSSR
jgi:FtsP/CotA-like multicopper oxidase with cupredoxin domain